MSVLKAHRSESKAEFVNTANKIYVQTINFLSRLSSRYSRLVADPVSGLAAEVLDNAEKANSIYPSDTTRKELRKQHLLESRAALMALDVHLAHCYELMMTNPSGCFTTGSGNSVSSSDAVYLCKTCRLGFFLPCVLLRIGGSGLLITTTPTTSAM